MSHKTLTAQPPVPRVWDRQQAPTTGKVWPLYASVGFVVVFNALAWSGIVVAIKAIL